MAKMMRVKRLTGSGKNTTFLTVVEMIAQEEASIIPRTKFHRSTKETGPVSMIGYLRGCRTEVVERTMRIYLLAKG